MRTGSTTFLLLAAACGTRSLPPNGSTDPGNLVGAWRSQIHFSTGTFAGTNDLEFLYAYNAGGTMTESSNYDEAANSSPPAYGVWKKTGPRQFETKYLFYQTRAPVPADGPGNDGAWLPAGHGVLTETITLSADGATYTSHVTYAAFDKAGKPMAGGGEGSGSAARIVFQGN